MDVAVHFSDEQRAGLKQVLPRQEQERVDEISELIAKAGARELLAQATGSAVFSSITDLRLFRIFCLIQEGVSLREAERLVAVIFKVTPSTAKRLLANTIARYGVDLRRLVVEAVGRQLDAGCWEQDRWNVDLPTAFMRETVHDILTGLTPPQPDPTPAQRGARLRFPNETYQALRAELGLKQRARKDPCPQ